MEERSASLEDIDQLVHMRLLFLREQNKSLTQEQEMIIKNQLPAYYKKHLNQDMFAFIVENEDKIIATAYLLINEKPAGASFLTGKVGEVLSVFTHSQYRRQGIARRLMEMVVEKGKEEKLDYIELAATEAGYPVYKSIGFEEENSNFVAMKFK